MVMQSPWVSCPGAQHTGMEAGRARAEESTNKHAHQGRVHSSETCPAVDFLTLHHPPWVLPGSHQLVSNFHLFHAANNSKGQMCLEKNQPRGIQCTYQNLSQASV